MVDADHPVWPEILAPDGIVHAIGCGDRDWTNCAAVSTALEQLRFRHPLLTIIEGGAQGADNCIGAWTSSVRQRGVAWVHVPAHWEDYEPTMRWQAGHDRNELMVHMLVAARDAGHTTIAIAFKEVLDDRLFGPKPQGARGGTEDLIRRAWAHEIPAWHCDGSGPPRLLRHREDPRLAL